MYYNYQYFLWGESVTPQICFPYLYPTLAVSGIKLFYFSRFRVFVFMCCYRCHASHIMSSCALHLHTCSSHAFEHFPRCPFCIPALRSPPVVISTFLSCVGIKHFRIGPRLAKRPWFTTGRPPVKFRAIWTSFDTPTVNRGTEKASCVLQPNTLPIWPKTHQKPLHHLERSITIAWPKTAPHLDTPSSLYLYIKTPPNFSFSFPPKT